MLVPEVCKWSGVWKFISLMRTDPKERLERPQELAGVNLAFVIGKYIIILLYYLLYTYVHMYV